MWSAKLLRTLHGQKVFNWIGSLSSLDQYSISSVRIPQTINAFDSFWLMLMFAWSLWTSALFLRPFLVKKAVTLIAWVSLFDVIKGLQRVAVSLFSYSWAGTRCSDQTEVFYSLPNHKVNVSLTSWTVSRAVLFPTDAFQVDITLHNTTLFNREVEVFPCFPVSIYVFLLFLYLWPCKSAKPPNNVWSMDNFFFARSSCFCRLWRQLQ